MKRIGFLSDLINTLRKTFGWCPEPPFDEDQFLAQITARNLNPYFTIAWKSISITTLIMIPLSVSFSVLFKLIWGIQLMQVLEDLPRAASPLLPVVSIVTACFVAFLVFQWLRKFWSSFRSPIKSAFLLTLGIYALEYLYSLFPYPFYLTVSGNLYPLVVILGSHIIFGLFLLNLSFKLTSVPEFNINMRSVKLSLISYGALQLIHTIYWMNWFNIVLLFCFLLLVGDMLIRKKVNIRFFYLTSLFWALPQTFPYIRRLLQQSIEITLHLITVTIPSLFAFSLAVLVFILLIFGGNWEGKNVKLSASAILLYALGSLARILIRWSTPGFLEGNLKPFYNVLFGNLDARTLVFSYGFFREMDFGLFRFAFIISLIAAGLAMLVTQNRNMENNNK